MLSGVRADMVSVKEEHCALKDPDVMRLISSVLAAGKDDAVYDGSVITVRSPLSADEACRTMNREERATLFREIIKSSFLRGKHELLTATCSSDDEKILRGVREALACFVDEAIPAAASEKNCGLVAESVLFVDRSDVRSGERKFYILYSKKGKRSVKEALILFLQLLAD